MHCFLHRPSWSRVLLVFRHNQNSNLLFPSRSSGLIGLGWDSLPSSTDLNLRNRFPTDEEDEDMY